MDDEQTMIDKKYMDKNGWYDSAEAIWMLCFCDKHVGYYWEFLSKLRGKK